jgi:hypothetical protein
MADRRDADDIMPGNDNPYADQPIDFDSLAAWERRLAIRQAKALLVRFRLERTTDEDDNRRRALTMGLYNVATRWLLIWVAFALPASVLWGVLLGTHQYVLLAIPIVLSALGLIAFGMSFSRYRLIRRHYP